MTRPPTPRGEEFNPSHEPPPRQPRDWPLIIGIILAVLVLAGVGTAAVLMYDRDGDGNKVSWHDTSTRNPHAAELGQLEELRRDVAEIDDEINSLNDEANARPYDDTPLNTMNERMRVCLSVQDNYREQAGKVPAEGRKALGLPDGLGGADQQTDCSPDNLGEGDRLSPPPPPSATAE